MIDVVRYTADKADEWNQFVARSKQGTFLHDRRYMDYHADRFSDCSLMCYYHDELVALLPGNEELGRSYCSHRGLTYGGLITNEKATAVVVQQLFRELNEWLYEQGFQDVSYKAVPHIYHQLPAEEDLYALFSVCHAHLVSRNISSVIDLNDRLKWRHNRREGVNRSRREGVVVQESDDYSSFWEVLNHNLMDKYGVRPVHTLQEMELLKLRFPEQIRLFTACKDGSTLGGTVIYQTPKVAHVQYISASAEGKHLRVMDAIFDYLLNVCTWPCRYFDFGTSNEDAGHTLVEPLIYQKEGFGARAICYDTYRWTL